jgi:hypothetical protein
MASPPTDDMARLALASRESGPPTLPFEVWHIIVWDEQLSLNDVAALRLTSRTLTTVAATRLFYCIPISKLNKDRDGFLAICHSPHLAPHVHEVEWLEICYDVDVFDRVALPLPSPINAEEDDTAALCRYFKDQAETSFWMANLPSVAGGIDPESVEDGRQRAVDEFRGPFMEALDLLPKLRTFISRPMPSTWIVNSDPEYRMTAGLFQRYERAFRLDMSTQSNDGLFSFLVPAMERPASTVTRLHWSDELPGFSYFRPLPAAAFSHLEALELCLTPKLGFEAALSHLEATCARAAPTLRHLKLCLEHGAALPWPRPSAVELAILGPALALSPSCNLRSLSLVAAQCSEDALVDIFKAHATSLRHVHLESINVSASLARRLAGLAVLQLESIKVVNDTSNASTVVCERGLARYINGEAPSQGPTTCCAVNDWEDAAFGACDREIRQLVEREGLHSPLATVGMREDLGFEPGSEAESDVSEDSVGYRRRTGPKWAWSRFFPANESFPSGVYCFEVPDSHPGGHATEYWNFTSRDGETACGTDPLEWFDDWDVDAGDVEEPTPYCEALREFWCHGSRAEMRMGSLASYLGEDSAAWLIQCENPPAGAVYYHEQQDPSKDDSGLGVLHSTTNTGWGSSWHTVEYPSTVYD